MDLVLRGCLPAVVAGVAIAASSMTPATALLGCDRTDWQTIGAGTRSVKVSRVAAPAGFLFVAGMTIDADGSPKAYHPDNIGLDDNRNAKNGETWVGVITVNGEPVVQSATDPAPGFYVSPTTLQDTTKRNTDPRRYVNSQAIAYIALPPEVLQQDGGRMGDFAAVVNLRNSSLAFAIVADRGPRRRIGEGSIALASALDINANARTGGTDRGVAYLVFSHSGDSRPKNASEIAANGADLLGRFGGKDKLAACATAG